MMEGMKAQADEHDHPYSNQTITAPQVVNLAPRERHAGSLPLYSAGQLKLGVLGLRARILGALLLPIDRKVHANFGKNPSDPANGERRTQNAMNRHHAEA